jgi:predicted nucleic acid-binding protein
MKSVFLDTSFLLALTSPKDAMHSRALAWERVSRGPFVTTEFILLEMADGFAARKGPAIAQAVIESLRGADHTTILGADSTWFDRGYQLFYRRLDKCWSLTDCISFEVMREMGITDALTHDHHFEQAGFRALLREEPPSN